VSASNVTLNQSDDTEMDGSDEQSGSAAQAVGTVAALAGFASATMWMFG
jgi:hypothetical protein